MSSSTFDVIIENGRWFDGLGAPARFGTSASATGASSRSARNRSKRARRSSTPREWVMPGFVDMHTHYDAEVLVAPGLTESVRHGVTTVFIGNCSLSTVYSTRSTAPTCSAASKPCRATYVLAALRDRKTWTDRESTWPNSSRFRSARTSPPMLGHSDIRPHVMGLGAPSIRRECRARARVNCAAWTTCSTTRSTRATSACRR